jgi:hypothetical protein
MPWNYRVIKTSEQYTIHEVYYKDDEMTIVDGYSATPAYPRGDSIEELIGDMERYFDATKEPILSEDARGKLRKLGVVDNSRDRGS